jgi:hypothetical protein
MKPRRNNLPRRFINKTGVNPDFESGLSDYAPNKLRDSGDIEKPSNGLSLGEGKYLNTSLDFEAGLSVVKDTVIKDVRSDIQLDKAVWSRSYINDLPDNAFLYIESGGKKDEEGKTKPRSLRHFPYRDKDGGIDLLHLRNAIARIPQAKIPGFNTSDMRRLQDRARRILERQEKDKGSKNKAEVPCSTDTFIDDIKMPYLLTWDSVGKKDSLCVGSSGLPSTLEQDVPPKYRYWKCNNIDDVRSVHRSLIESQLFTPDNVKIVNGEVRRVIVERVEKLYLPPVYDSSESVMVPRYLRPIERVSSFLSRSEGSSDVVLFGEDITSVLDLDVLMTKTRDLNKDYVLAFHDTDEIRKKLRCSLFKFKGFDNLIFTTNLSFENDLLIEWIRGTRSEEIIKYVFSDQRLIPLIKSKEEERIIFGVVLEPDTVDLQDDIVTKEEIKLACYKFMEEFGYLGKQHKEIVNGKLVLLENFLAPTDFKINEQDVKKGSWLIKERVVDDELWDGIKKGEYTGYSIGGSAVRKPVK